MIMSQISLLKLRAYSFPSFQKRVKFWGEKAGTRRYEGSEIGFGILDTPHLRSSRSHQRFSLVSS
jgi:hypothetical protein